MKATCFFVLILAAVISADLQSDINEILSQFPQNQKDDLVVDSQQVLKSQIWLNEFIKTSEVKDLVDFFERKGINVAEIVFNFINNPNKNQILQDIFKSGDVIASVMKALSSPKIAEIIKNKKETSPEFGSLVDAVKDPEFKTLFYRAINSKAILDNIEPKQRGFFKKLWKKVLAHGIQVSIPFAG